MAMDSSSSANHPVDQHKAAPSNVPGAGHRRRILGIGLAVALCGIGVCGYPAAMVGAWLTPPPATEVVNGTAVKTGSYPEFYFTVTHDLNIDQQWFRRLGNWSDTFSLGKVEIDAPGGVQVTFMNLVTLPMRHKRSSGVDEDTWRVSISWRVAVPADFPPGNYQVKISAPIIISSNDPYVRVDPQVGSQGKLLPITLDVRTFQSQWNQDWSHYRPHVCVLIVWLALPGLAGGLAAFLYARKQAQLPQATARKERHA
jgi:hypothetical protein